MFKTTSSVRRLHLSEANEPPEGIETPAIRGIREAHHYTDPTVEPLRSVIARKIGVDADQIFIGNGLDEVILILALSLNFDSVLMSAQTFKGHRNAFSATRHRVYELPLLSNYEQDIHGFECAMNTNSSGMIVIVANPHNPTGMPISSLSVSRLMESVSISGGQLVLDEAYADFAKYHTTGLQFITRTEGPVVLRSFSKGQCIAGLRLGYAVGPTDIVKNMQNLAEKILPYRVNQVALSVGLWLFDSMQEQILNKVRDGVIERREILRSSLSKAGVRTLVSEAPFLLAQFHSLAGSVVERLKKHGFLICDASRFDFPGWLRLGIPGADDLAEFQSQLLTVILEKDKEVTR